MRVTTQFEDTTIQWTREAPPRGCPASYKYVTTIDGIEVRRSLTKARTVGSDGVSITATPKKGRTVDALARALVAMVIRCKAKP